MKTGLQLLSKTVFSLPQWTESKIHYILSKKADMEKDHKSCSKDKLATKQYHMFKTK